MRSIYDIVRKSTLTLVLCIRMAVNILQNGFHIQHRQVVGKRFCRITSNIGKQVNIEYVFIP